MGAGFKHLPPDRPINRLKNSSNAAQHPQIAVIEASAYPKFHKLANGKNDPVA
jgi:hypothetical protein